MALFFWGIVLLGLIIFVPYGGLAVAILCWLGFCMIVSDD